MNIRIFDNPVQTYQFLFVVNYINKLSDIFYVEDKIKTEDQYQSITILNNFFQYVHQSDNETETKLNLAHRLLRGSDLYGGKENETLDIGYVNATFDYIISNVVFSQFGGVYGYLAVMANTAKNLSLSSFKQEILDNLADLQFITENSSISKLSPLAVNKVFETLILPQFPETKKDMNVTDISFIYAQAGLKLARSTGIDLTNLTFDDLILFSQTIEMSFFTNNIHVSALKIFALPALMLYASERNETFKKEIIAFLLEDGDFWSEVFHNLFSHLRDSFELAESKLYENNTFYQLVEAMSNFKNRTVLAEENLRKYCSFKEDSEYEKQIPYYKFLSTYICPNSGEVLPNLNEVYSKSIDEIKEKYRLHMRNLLLDKISLDLIMQINSPYSTVYAAQAVSEPTCFPCLPKVHTIDSSKFLFVIRASDMNSYYAFVNNNNSMSILVHEDGEDEFLKGLGLPVKNGLPPRPTFESDKSRVFKQPPNHKTEAYKDFVNKAANDMAERFKEEIYQFGYEKTLGEKIVDVALHFVPFYDCINDAKAGKTVDSIYSCGFDILTFVPIGGKVLYVTGKLTKVIVGVSVRSLALRHALRLTLFDTVKQAAGALVNGVQKMLLNKQMFKSFALGLVRTIDPGFELASTLVKRGGRKLAKVLQKSITKIGKEFPSIGLDLPKFERLFESLRKSRSKSLVVSKRQGYDTFIKTIPGGVHPYGPTYVRLPSGKAELRKTIGFNSLKPFVVSRISKRGTVYYRRIYLKNGKLSGIEYKMNLDGFLWRVQKPFRQHIKTIVTEGLSGRGKLMDLRAKEIDDASVEILKSDLQVTKHEAMFKMRQYYLSFMPLELPPPLDLSITSPLNYQTMPTYRQFVNDWIKNKRIDESYSKWLIKDPKEMRKMLHDVKVDNIHSRDTAIMRIERLYGVNHQIQSGINIDQLFNNYKLYQPRIYVRFEDYYAVKNWMKNSYGRMNLNEIETIRANYALYKFSLRLVNREEIKVPIILYSGKTFDVALFHQAISQFEKKVISLNVFTSCQKNPIMEVRSSNLPGESKDSKIISVLYKMHIDSVYMTGFLNRLFPFENSPFIIFPEMKFRIDNIGSTIIEGKKVTIVEMHNLPVTRDVWIFNMMKNMETLRNSRITFNFP